MQLAIELGTCLYCGAPPDLAVDEAGSTHAAITPRQRCCRGCTAAADLDADMQAIVGACTLPRDAMMLMAVVGVFEGVRNGRQRQFVEYQPQAAP